MASEPGIQSPNTPLPPLDGGFADDLAAWSKIAKNVYVWDYPANCYYAQIPYPDFDVLGPNFAFYSQQNVKGMMLCGGGLLADDLGALRCYVLSRLMWQPSADVKPLMDEFKRIQTPASSRRATWRGAEISPTRSFM